MSFNVNRFNGNLLTTVVDGTVNDSVTDIKLLGRGVSNYGEIVAEDLVHMVEHFANSSAPSKPIVGQIWYDSANGQLKLLISESPDTWLIIATLVDAATLSPATLPTQPRPAGELFWLDGAGIDAAGLMYVSDGTAWLSFAPLWQSSEPEVNNAYDFGSTTKRWRTINAVDGNFSGTVTGVSSSAKYADLAERYSADRVLQPGTVVMLGGDFEITPTVQAWSEDVFGVISENPAFCMNIDAGSNITHPFVAMSGRVPVRVIGKVQKGERLVSSNIPGVAMSATNAEINGKILSIIGRALVTKSTDDEGLIEIAVGVK